MASHHFLGDTEVSLEWPFSPATSVSYRSYRPIDTDAFLFDLKDTQLLLDHPKGLDQLVDLNDSPLINKHVSQMSQSPLTPWYNKHIQIAKNHRRYCEQLWVRSDLSVYFEMFQVARLDVQNNFATTKSQYYNNKIKECKATSLLCC